MLLLSYFACPASGSVSSSISVTLTVPPRIAPFEMADRAVNWGDSVSAVCTVVNGDTPLEITWALNGMPIEETHRISVTTTKRNSLLSIDSASPSHAGTYTCVASNAAGATTYSAELTVNGTYDKGIPVLPGSFLSILSSLFPDRDSRYRYHV